MWGVECQCVRGALGLTGSGFEPGIIVQVSGFEFWGVECNHADARAGPTQF